MDVENELAIRNVIARVARHTDQWVKESDLLNDYTEDCIWHLEGLPPYKGHEGLKRRMHEVKDAGICGPGLPMRHCVTSLEVIGDPSDANTAYTKSFVIMMTMMGDKGDTPGVRGYGQMDDTLKLGDGRWRIAVRKGSAFWK